MVDVDSSSRLLHIFEKHGKLLTEKIKNKILLLVNGIPRALAQRKVFGLLKKIVVKDIFHMGTYTNDPIMNYNFNQIIYNSNYITLQYRILAIDLTHLKLYDR